MVTDQQGEHGSQWAAICSIGPKIGCTPETLRKWVRQRERDEGLRPGLSVALVKKVVSAFMIPLFRTGLRTSG